MSNGRLSQRELASIGGGYYLRHDAAAAFNAMCAEAQRRYGTRVLVISAYRTLEKQRYLWELYQSGRGNLAAYPGTSNHGWGLAVDLASPYMRQIVNAIGAKYGWSKSWSDAPSEWWHIKYRPGVWNGRTQSDGGLPVRYGDTGRLVKNAQVWLRRGGYLPKGNITGRFGPLTRAAVRRFQRHVHLAPDGVVGPKTYAALRRRYHVNVWRKRKKHA